MVRLGGIGGNIFFFILEHYLAMWIGSMTMKYVNYILWGPQTK